MKTQTRTNRPIKAIINPGRTFTAPVLPEWTIAVADRLAAEFAYLGPALHAAAQREEAARKARATIETINDGPRCLGWYYKAGPGAPQSLLRTGWHAVGEPCPREVSDAILDEVYRARRNYQTIAQSIWDAAAAAGLEDVERRHGQITRGSVVCRVQYAAAGIGSGQ